MSIECRIKAKNQLADYGQVEITITDENDQFIENQTFNNFDELVAEVEYNENIGNGVYL